MSSDEIAVRARNISKHYMMFARPEDRLKQMIVPRLQRTLGRPPKRYFQDFAALSDVSFDIRRGETVGIIGRNGSGKSTLLQIVCGTLQPTGGNIEVNGRIAALLELGAGFNPEFSGRENVYLNAAILGLSRAETDARFDDIARFADIGDFIEHPVKTYSSGMYVRLAFATAINVDPDILVVDEALAVGDEAFSRKCYARIEQIKEKGGTILFVSHAAQTIVQLCDRAILLDRGELILEGRPKLVTTHYQRLVNARPFSLSSIRDSIISLNTNEKYNIQHDVVERLTEATQEFPDEPTSEPPLLHDSMTENIQADAAAQIGESYGATIRDVRLQNAANQNTNRLGYGRRYTLSYLTEFQDAAKNVGFGIFLRTLQGFGISGMHTSLSRSYRIELVEAGSCLEVLFEFTCPFVAGSYSISVSVRAGEDRLLLHNISDAIIFTVEKEPEPAIVGQVGMNIIPQITILPVPPSK